MVHVTREYWGYAFSQVDVFAYESPLPGFLASTSSHIKKEKQTIITDSIVHPEIQVQRNFDYIL